MHKRKKPADLINCRCKKDQTGSGPGRMFKANGADCVCSLVDKAGISPEFKVKRVAVSVG